MTRREAQRKRHLEEDPEIEGLIQRKRLTLGPHRRHLGEATEVDGLPTSVEVGAPSLSTEARMTEEAQSRVPEMINIEDYHLGPGLGASVGVRAGANVYRRKFCLKDPSVVRRIM